jgi:multiple sugar transport system ATP-binding protein
MSRISVEKLRKVFGKTVVAVDDVSLEVGDGEFFVLVGPSGSGKTTILRVVAGLEEPSGGSVHLDADDVTRWRPRERDVAMVFQDYALYPNMTVRENIGFGLKQRKVPKAEVAAKVDELAGVLELDGLLERRPSQLSGGQRQRVALGRAIARQPRAFLMDEPLSNLDANLRTTMRSVLSQLRERLRTTTLYVTHDQVEAMTLGDRVAVMRNGRVEQLARPQELYDRPTNLFVAAFIGSPHINLVESRVADGHVALGDARLPIPATARARLADGSGVVLGVRPHDLEDAAFCSPEWPAVTADIAVRNELGSEIQALFPVDGKPVVREELSSALEGGELAEFDLVGGGRRPMFTAQLDARSGVRVGAPLRVAVDPERIYLFDVVSGELVAAPARQSATPTPGEAA